MMAEPDFKHGRDAHAYFSKLATSIRSGEIDLGRRHYAVSLAVGCMEAIFCGYKRVIALEFGVAAGNGLLDLCRAARYFHDTLDLEIRVIGLDNGQGLPPPRDYRDHPEFWATGQFRMGEPDALRTKLPDFANLIVGDIGDTTRLLEREFEGARLAFAAIDVDYYFSAKAALDVLRFDASSYLPAVPMYFDDLLLDRLTTNSWCGEPLAINEFNADNPYRKIQEKPLFRIPRFYACQILDHPIRTGSEQLRPGFHLLNVMAI